MKVIFLDIDGVLNNDFTSEKFNGFTGIKANLRDLFLNWLKTKDFEVILSSSWRLPSAYGDFKQHLKDNGLSWISETPYLSGMPRGFEIQQSLEQHDIPQYAILDDMGPEEFLPHQRPFLVRTSPVHGLRQKNLHSIDFILKE